MTTQTFLTDLHEVSVAKYAGYAVRWLPNERQWVVADSGDLDDLISDVRSGAQTISNAIALLKVYDELRQIKGGSTTAPAMKPASDDFVELVPTKIESREEKTWYTQCLNTATFLIARGNELLSAYDVEGRTKFAFAYDNGLNEAIALYNAHRIRVEPHVWVKAAHDMRAAMREAKGKK